MLFDFDQDSTRISARQMVRQSLEAKQRDIYNSHRHRIFSVSFYMTGSEMEAESILQDTFIRAFEKAEEPDGAVVDAALLQEFYRRDLLPDEAPDPVPASVGQAGVGNVLRADLEEAIRRLTAQYGRAPMEPEVAQEMGLELEEYQQLLGELKGLEIGTLNLERSEDSGEEELAYIPNGPEDDPLFRCLRGEMRERLAAVIDQLPERERLVVTLYYYEEMTMKEIGLVLGVVESRVSQIHSSAVVHLRARLAELGAKRR